MTRVSSLDAKRLGRREEATSRQRGRDRDVEAAEMFSISRHLESLAARYRSIESRRVPRNRVCTVGSRGRKIIQFISAFTRRLIRARRRRAVRNVATELRYRRCALAVFLSSMSMYTSAVRDFRHRAEEQRLPLSPRRQLTSE